MQDRGYELPRTPPLGRWVNRPKIHRRFIRLLYNLSLAGPPPLKVLSRQLASLYVRARTLYDLGTARAETANFRECLFYALGCIRARRERPRLLRPGPPLLPKRTSPHCWVL